jgi:Ca2+-binding RTX toxin-like protein
MTTTVFSSSVTYYGDGVDPLFTYAADGDSLIVNAGVTLSNLGIGDLVYAFQNGNISATINGTLSAKEPDATINAYYSGLDLTVGSMGRVEALYGDAVRVGPTGTVANHGVILAGTGFGVIVSGSIGSATVENWGTIFGEQGAVNVQGFPDSLTVVNHDRLEAGGPFDGGGHAGSNSTVFSSARATHIVNDGTILAADEEGAGIMISGGAATIDNSGAIQSEQYYGISARFTNGTTFHITNEGTIDGANGSLALALGADTVTNDGQLYGRAILGGGNDVYHGENGRVFGAVWGQAGNDLLVGGAFADMLGGGSGNDTVTGGAGADTLTGSTGADLLSAGAGADVFRFATAGESVGDAIVASGGALAFAGAGAPGGDRIDVSAIDANATLAGSQHFVFGTSQDIGRLWAVDVGNATHIRGNVAGGAAPEFDLAINDGAMLHAGDYAGVDFIL